MHGIAELGRQRVGEPHVAALQRVIVEIAEGRRSLVEHRGLEVVDGVAVRDRHTRPNQRLDRRVKTQGGDHVGGARRVRRPAVGDAGEGILEVGLGDGLVADGHAPSVRRPLEHHRDPEAGRPVPPSTRNRAG